MSAVSKKVLLMGKSGSGKTSMRSIIFASFMVDVEHHTVVHFLGDMTLNLWDCGGQGRYFESYFGGERDSVFQGVALLIHVFDVESEDKAEDVALYKKVLEALEERSPGARVFVLLHKMDLVKEDRREETYNKRAEEIRAVSGTFRPHVFATSIWDETLYRAWSRIAHSLIPNAAVLERNLEEFAERCGADEVVLFEKLTFLVVSQATRKAPPDEHRFEKTSNIVKQFKLACANNSTPFEAMRVANSKFSAIVDAFTATTYILVVVSDPKVPPGSIALNISIARPHFERIVADTAHPPPSSVSTPPSYMGSLAASSYLEEHAARAAEGSSAGAATGGGGESKE